VAGHRDERSEASTEPADATGRRPGIGVLTLQILLVAAAYYVAARLGLELSLVKKNVTPLWPPTGIAVAALLVLGRRVWPGIAVGAFLVNLPISTDAVAAAATAAGNTLAPLLAAILLERVGFRRAMDRGRDALAIVFLGALLSMIVSASIGTATLLASGAIERSELPSAWAVWWTGDAMGVLVVAPFLLTLGVTRLRRPASWPRVAEAAASFLVLTVVTIAVTQAQMRLLFVVIPVVGWIAWRFQQRGAAPAALLVAVVTTWSAAEGLGPFADGSLFEKMLTLQVFNATVVLTSWFFAAIVTERIRSREALEQSAHELEERVRERTAELSTANERLTAEMAEREGAERRLRAQGRQLADAQRVARIGSWEWAIPDQQVSWSDEMYRIHGHEPQAFPVTFDRAMAQVLGEDAERIRRNVEDVLREPGADRDLPQVEYRITRADGAERVLIGRARVRVGADGMPLRLVGTVQDVTETRRAEREHDIAETLQRSLLPEGLPRIPGVSLAARYLPASTDMAIGGDWFDVIQLPNGRVALAIGDVAGHGLPAASSMGQVRMAVRAYALEEESPAEVMDRVHTLVQQLLVAEMVTLVFLVFDPETCTVRFANAGHPPPLVIEDGKASFLTEGLSPPLGVVTAPAGQAEAVATLAPGAMLLLYTDGLVERRGVSIRDGLRRLGAEAAGAGSDLEALCDHVLRAMVELPRSDDVAMLALRPVPLTAEPLVIDVPAEPRVLAPLRQTLRRWLAELEADDDDVTSVLIACGEACANAIQHAYGAREGRLQVEFAHADGMVQLAVRDEGSWRPGSGSEEGGLGLPLMRELMDAVDVEQTAGGTVVRMRRRLRAGAGTAPRLVEQ
jgi:integral membrane sensor domain MASE1/anti-sigma regulatory factor (Ser/Thr protein kinase)